MKTLSILFCLFLFNCSRSSEFEKGAFYGAYQKNRALHIVTYDFPNGKLLIDHKNKNKKIKEQLTDWNTSWSKNGNKIVFFRHKGDISNIVGKTKNIGKWKTKIVIVNADGTGEKELTSGEFSDFNASFTRDGKNTIFFNRFFIKKNIWQTYITTANSKPGEEKLVSNPKYTETVMSSLKDGRLLLYSGRQLKLFAFKPNPGKLGRYEEVKFLFNLPRNTFITRFSLSVDETKITYTLDKSFVAGGDFDPWDQKDCILFVASFNNKTLTVTNPVEISPDNRKYIDGYSRFSFDGKRVIFHSTKSGKYQFYEYDISSKKIKRISKDEDSVYLFPCFKNTPI